MRVFRATAWLGLAVGAALLAVGVGRVAGVDTGWLLIAGAFLSFAVGGVAAWQGDRLVSDQRGRAVRVVTAQRDKLKALLDRLMPREGWPQVHDIRRELVEWGAETQTLFEKDAPEFVREFDSPIMPQPHPYASETPQAVRELSGELNGRITQLNGFLAHLRLTH